MPWSDLVTNEPSLFDLEPPKPAELAKPARRDTPMTEQTRRVLVARGIMDEHTGATRNARYSRCANCKSRIIIGFDADFGYRAVECDPTPLSVAGELAAMLANRRIYRLTSHGGHWRIDDRDIFSLRATPPGTKGTDILVTHVCGDSTQFDSIPTVAQFPPKTAADLPDKPPF